MIDPQTGLSRPRRRQLALAALLAVGALSALYVLLPAVAGLEQTWSRIAEGDGRWLIAAAGFEVLSFAAYVVAFHGVFGGDAGPVNWPASYRITMAGLVATRLLATAGAGGIALTVWALDRLGMDRRGIASRTATFLVLLYGPFMAALVVGGLGLWAGLLPGPAPFGLTVVPALFGAVVIVLALTAALFSTNLDAAIARFRVSSDGATRWARAIEVAPSTVSTGVRGAISLVPARRSAMPGALGWWAFDICVLLACLRAFGGEPAVSVVAMAYFVGMLANTLPVPGGIGAVEGGMIGALIGLGVSGGLAIVAVLSYRLFAFWLPVIPGVVAYVQLLRSPRRRERTRFSADARRSAWP